jgi:DNA-binding NarL/FixJ family response regulator
VEVPKDDAATTISVFLADDNLLVREGVRALLDRQPDIQVVGVAADYDELVEGAEAVEAQPAARLSIRQSSMRW